MDKELCRIIGSMVLIIICSCTTGREYITENRKYSTGLGAEESVVILLNTFRSHDKPIESEEEEKSLADSLRKAGAHFVIRQPKDLLRLIS